MAKVNAKMPFLLSSPLLFSSSLTTLLSLFLYQLFYSLPFDRHSVMHTEDAWQQLQCKDEIDSVKVYSGSRNDKVVPYILVEDIQDHFQDATTFRCAGKLVNFMRDADGKR